MVGEYTELLVLNCYTYKFYMILKLLLVLNCYTYKFYMILKLPISHRDNLYLKYPSLTDIQLFYRINCLA
ncbi:hypothetical protein Hanom_Chr08g00684061 [Helianthus anomalus]